MVRRKDMQVRKAQRVPMKRNPKTPTPRHIIIKMANFKEKERILKAVMEKYTREQRNGETAGNIQGSSNKAIS